MRYYLHASYYNKYSLNSVGNVLKPGGGRQVQDSNSTLDGNVELVHFLFNLGKHVNYNLR